MEELAREYVTYARHLSLNGCYSKAFDLYIIAFDKHASSKSLFEQEFRVVLIKLNELLAVAGKIEDIFVNFKRAIDAFPNNIHLLNDIGRYLYKFGFYNEAWCHFQQALKLDSGFVSAEKNLNSIKNLLVERWHYRMLNDKIRNEAYREAIHQTVIPGKDSVLDLGTGTGLLALYAHECSPVETTGCDGSEVMATLAETIIAENKKTEISIVNNMSTSMEYADIGGKRSLVLTEMFDAGLFGEHVLQTLTHAWEELINNVGRVIPNKAEFFVAGVKSDHLNMKYQLCTAAKVLLNIPSLNVHMLACNETYDCEDVHLFKDLKYMTDAKSVVKIDFNNINDIQDKLNNSEPYNIELKVKQDGEINSIVGWFNLYLTDKVTITTDPKSKRRANAWQQAVFFDNIPKSVRENQTLDLDFVMNGSKLTLLPMCNSEIDRISPEVLRFLNDAGYMKMISSCIGMACVYLGQMTEMSEVNIADLNPFPLFGLLMLKRGTQSLVCCARTESDEQFFIKVFSANNIPLSKVTVLVGDNWSQEVFRDEKFHAVFCNVFELCGDIDLHYKEIAQHLRNAHLHQGGLFMPAKITMIGQLVNSHWLDINNRVYDENVSNYKIAMHMNKYQVSQNFFIDFTNLEYTPLSDPVILTSCNSGMRSEVVNVPIIEDGDANAILCWYSMELMEDLEDISTNRTNSFIDGIVFLANPKVAVTKGSQANVLRCVDPDGSFKLMIDNESH